MRTAYHQEKKKGKNAHVTMEGLKSDTTTSIN